MKEKPVIRLMGKNPGWKFFWRKTEDGKERLKKWLKIETTDGAIKIAEAA